jgi:hypothetical protein
MPLRQILLAPVQIVNKALSIIEDKVSALEFNYIKRLLYDGLKRDIIFIRGMTVGIKLIGLPKKKLDRLIELLEGGIKNADSGSKILFSEEDLKEIDEVLKGVFTLGTRRRIINVIRNADSVLLRNLINSIKKSVSE